MAEPAENPQISIIMPAYNCAKYVLDSVASVTDQTYSGWELLIIDDCSTDDTAQRLQTLNDPRIRVQRNEKNLGVAATRNKAVKMARGEWVAFLDSDDLWEKDKLEKQLERLRRTPEAVLLYTGSAFIDENGRRSSYILPVPETIGYRELLKQNLISCSSVLVQKKYLEKYPMPTVSRIHEDYAVWLRILQEGKTACGINEPLLIYRISGSSKSGNKLLAARMNWNTYQYVGLSLPSAIRYMASYTVRGLMKYAKMKVGTV